MSRPIVIQAYPMMNRLAEERLAGSVELRTASDPSEDGLIAIGEGAVAMIARSPSHFGAKLFDGIPSLRVISGTGHGLECIDVPAATERGVTVIYNPGGAPGPVAEFVIGAIVVLQRNMFAAGQFLRSGGSWTPKDRFIGMETSGQDLGLVGFGPIGRDVARRAMGGLDMHVRAYDPFVAVELMREAGVEPVNDLLQLFASCDVISLHAPILPSTRHLIGAEHFAAMKRDAVFVNTARGPVVDEAALISALASGTFRAAAIDVYDPEPPASDSPLLQMPNVIVTPHIAGITRSAMARMSEDLVDNVLSAINGREPSHVVNPETWPPVRGIGSING